MTDKKVCPVMTSSTYYTLGGNTPHKVDCIKDECAWWEPDGRECVAKNILFLLGLITDEIRR